MKLNIKIKKIVIEISGTPGTGKTTICKMLENDGYKILFLNEFFKKLKILNKYDQKRKCYIVNMNKVNTRIKKYISKIKKNIIIIDSHIGYKFSNYSIILRTRPDILQKRLKKRNYSMEKIKENVNSEALDIILYNTYKKYKSEKYIFEIDTTYRNKIEVKNICN